MATTQSQSTKPIEPTVEPTEESAKGNTPQQEIQVPTILETPEYSEKEKIILKISELVQKVEEAQKRAAPFEDAYEKSSETENTLKHRIGNALEPAIALVLQKAVTVAENDKKKISDMSSGIAEEIERIQDELTNEIKKLKAIDPNDEIVKRFGV